MRCNKNCRTRSIGKFSSLNGTKQVKMEGSEEMEVKKGRTRSATKTREMIENTSEVSVSKFLPRDCYVKLAAARAKAREWNENASEISITKYLPKDCYVKMANITTVSRSHDSKGKIQKADSGKYARLNKQLVGEEKLDTKCWEDDERRRKKPRVEVDSDLFDQDTDMIEYFLEEDTSSNCNENNKTDRDFVDHDNVIKEEAFLGENLSVTVSDDVEESNEANTAEKNGKESITHQQRKRKTDYRDGLQSDLVERKSKESVSTTEDNTHLDTPVTSPEDHAMCGADVIEVFKGGVIQSVDGQNKEQVRTGRNMEKSAAALRREEEAKNKFEEAREQLESREDLKPGTKITMELLKPSCHLTDPCWTTFLRHVRSHEGWVAKRREATAEEKQQHKETRKGRVYFIDLVFNVSKGIIEKKPVTAIQGNSRAGSIGGMFASPDDDEESSEEDETPAEKKAKIIDEKCSNIGLAEHKGKRTITTRSSLNKFFLVPKRKKDRDENQVVLSASIPKKLKSNLKKKKTDDKVIYFVRNGVTTTGENVVKRVGKRIKNINRNKRSDTKDASLKPTTEEASITPSTEEASLLLLNMKRKAESRQTHDKAAKKLDTRPRGFKRGLCAEKIVAATTELGELHFLLKWRGSDEMDLIPAKELNDKLPRVVIRFYEERINMAEV